MAARPDYYKTLEVDKSATPEAIKKSYRRLARKYHPDANPGDKAAEERFKRISEAHDVLSDADKRKAYDRGGLGFGGGNPFGGGGGRPGPGGGAPGSFSDILSDLFGSASDGVRGRAGGGARTKPVKEKGRDLDAEVSLSFEQAIEGAQVPVSVTTHAACGTCRGTGARPGTQPKVCPLCEGRGVESQGQGLFSISRPCTRCNGSGTVIETPCATCKGEGRLRELKRYTVKIPAGIKDGSKIRLAGKGEAGLRGGPAGDLFVICRVQPSRVFKAKGDHLEVEVPITVAEAMLGAEVEVPTLRGTKRLRVAPGTRHGTLQRLRGEGPQKLGGSAHGDLHFRFVIDVPASGSDAQRAAVEALAAAFPGDPRKALLEDARRAAA